MSLFRALFGPSKEEVWTQLAQRVEGRFVDGGLFSAGVGRAPRGGSTAALARDASLDGKAKSDRPGDRRSD